MNSLAFSMVAYTLWFRCLLAYNTECCGPAMPVVSDLHFVPSNCIGCHCGLCEIVMMVGQCQLWRNGVNVSRGRAKCSPGVLHLPDDRAHSPLDHTVFYSIAYSIATYTLWFRCLLAAIMWVLCGIALTWHMLCVVWCGQSTWLFATSGHGQSAIQYSESV